MGVSMSRRSNEMCRQQLTILLKNKSFHAGLLKRHPMTTSRRFCLFHSHYQQGRTIKHCVSIILHFYLVPSDHIGRAGDCSGRICTTKAEPTVLCRGVVRLCFPAFTGGIPYNPSSSSLSIRCIQHIILSYMRLCGLKVR